MFFVASFLANLVILTVILYLQERDKVIVFSNDGTPFDLAAVLLTGSAVIVTVVGVGVAILAFLGYRNIKQAAVRSAKKAAVPVAKQAADTVSREVAGAVAMRMTREYLESREGEDLPVEDAYAKAYRCDDE